jgi:hypothetical protein
MAKKIEKNALKSHRERVEDLNKYLDSLSEVRPSLAPAPFQDSLTDVASRHAQSWTWLTTPLRAELSFRDGGDHV